MVSANGTTHKQLHVTDRTYPERSHRTGAHHATGNDSPPPRYSRAPAPCHRSDTKHSASVTPTDSGAPGACNGTISTRWRRSRRRSHPAQRVQNPHCPSNTKRPLATVTSRTDRSRTRNSLQGTAPANRRARRGATEPERMRETRSPSCHQCWLPRCGCRLRRLRWEQRVRRCARLAPEPGRRWWHSARTWSLGRGAGPGRGRAGARICAAACSCSAVGSAGSRGRIGLLVLVMMAPGYLRDHLPAIPRTGPRHAW
jgi:hypothetical protein